MSKGRAGSSQGTRGVKGTQVEIVQVPDTMDPDEYLQKNSAEDLAYLLTKTRISLIEFYIHQLKPVIVITYRRKLSSLKKIAPLIAKSITAQIPYIHILADNLPSFDYQLEVGQIVNEDRIVKGRKESRGAASSSDWIYL